MDKKERMQGEKPLFPCEPPPVIAAQMRRVNNLIGRRFSHYQRENEVGEVTPMHGWILGYLYKNRDHDVFQRDIERDFSITRSTVTNILQLMEKKGYILRESVEQDARLKKLVLTDAGAEAHKRVLRSLRQTDAYLDGLLSDAERAELLRLLLKLRDGLD